MSKKKIDYKSAGVDIDAGNNAVELIKDKSKKHPFKRSTNWNWELWLSI